MLETSGVEWLIPVLFLFFNLVVYLSVYSFFANGPNVAYGNLAIGLTVALVVAIVGVYVAGVSLIKTDDAMVRAIGTFNNPNQLAYFSICSAGLVTVLFVNRYITLLVFIALYICSVLLVMVSLSKAALIAILFYLVIFLRKTGTKMVVISISIITFALSMVAFGPSVDLSNFQFYQRLEGIGNDSDDSVEGRGMGLFMHIDENIILGWGEGFVKLTEFGKEVHSTLGNILISYGIVGFIIFMTAMYFIFLGLRKRHGLAVGIALFLPMMLYGIAHNGIRFSVFWIYLAILSSMGLVVKELPVKLTANKPL